MLSLGIQAGEQTGSFMLSPEQSSRLCSTQIPANNMWSVWAAPPADGGRHLAELGTCFSFFSLCSGSGFHDDPASVPTWHYRTVITTTLDIKAQNAKTVICGRAQYLQNPTTSWWIQWVKSYKTSHQVELRCENIESTKHKGSVSVAPRQRRSALYTSTHIIIITYHRQCHIDIYIYLTWRFQLIDCDRRLHTSNQPILNHLSIYLHK